MSGLWLCKREEAGDLGRACECAVWQASGMEDRAKLAYRINEAAEAVGLSRATIYNAINAGELQMGKIHGRSVIRAEELRRWFDASFRVVEKRA